MMQALIDDIDREVQDAYQRGRKEMAGEISQAKVGMTIPSLVEYATHEQRLTKLERRFPEDYGLSKIDKLQHELRELAKVAQHVQKLEAQVGSLLKDRYEYATLTSRVHDLERWQRAGDPPRHLIALEEKVDLLSKGLGDAERHCERNAGRIDGIIAGTLSSTQLVPELMKRLAALEQWKPAIDGLAVNGVNLERRLEALEQAAGLGGHRRLPYNGDPREPDPNRPSAYEQPGRR